MSILWLSYWRNLLFHKVLCRSCENQVFVSKIVFMVATYLFYLLSSVEFGISCRVWYMDQEICSLPHHLISLLAFSSVMSSICYIFLKYCDAHFVFPRNDSVQFVYRIFFPVLFYFIVLHTECISIFKMHASYYFVNKRFRRLNNI